jgi:hypothetical protein
MRDGDFARAWQVSDRLLAQRKPGETFWHLPRHEQPVWDGRPLAGRRVLVRCYHGLGDTIQFARFLPAVSCIADKTIVWAQPALLDLLRTLPDAGGAHRELLPLHDGTPEVDYDVDVEIMELAHALRITMEDLPGPIPYLSCEPRVRTPTISQKLSVGVLAEAGDWDARRSVPPEQLLRLREHPQLVLFNLQLTRKLPGLADRSTPDVSTLARRLRSLDLVVTPDTMLAHLAGALGVRTWTLLPFDADWRWMQPARNDSPWYPTMRLFRQPRPGDWRSVIDALLAAADAL